MIPFTKLTIPHLPNLFNRSDFIHGSDVSSFESSFASYINKNHCIGVANGTDALEIAIESLQLPPHSSILVQSNSCIATAIATQNQRTPYNLILVDISKETQMIDLNDLIHKLESNQSIKLLIVTHLFGYMPDMIEIQKICKHYNIYLIEDCAQAHGATFQGLKAGAFGDLSCFSFYPTKNLGALGDGGAILTDDKDKAIWIRMRANMGSLVKNQFEIIGRNSRLDTIQASILLHKLPPLDKQNEQRRKVASIYQALLKDISEIQFIQYHKDCIPVYHLMVIRCQKRDELKSYLESKKIQTMIHYPTAIEDTQAFISLNEKTNARELSKEILSLPMYPDLIDSIEDIIRITEEIRGFYGYPSNHYENTMMQLETKMNHLHCLNQLKVPFKTKRIFYVDGFKDKELPIIRGNHMHKNTNQFLIVINGFILLELNDKQMIMKKNQCILIEKNTWIRYSIYDKETILMVMCDTIFEENILVN